MKRVSKEWHHSSSPKPKKFWTEPSAEKVMLTLFWDEKGIILEHYTPRGTTVTSASYSDLLKNHLRPAIKSKRRGLLSSGVLLQHDNARPTLPYNSCNNHRPAFSVSSSSTIITWHCPKWFPCLDHWKKQWEERSSILMKRYATRRRSGCAHYQKFF